MKNSHLFIFALTSILLVACGRTNNDAGPGRPDLRAEAMAAKPLSAEDKAEFARIFKKNTAASPDVRLFFTNDYTKQDLAKSFARLNDAGKSLLNKVKANCQIEPEKETTISKSADGRSSKIERIRSIKEKANCPLDYSSEDTVTTNLTVDEANKSVSGSTRTDSKTMQAYKDPEALKSVAIIGSQTEGASTLTFLSVKSGGGNTLSSGMMMFDSLDKGQVLLDSGENVMTLIKGHGGVNFTNKEVNLNVLLSFTKKDGKAFVYGMFLSKDKMEILINGEVYTAEKAESDFGIPTPTDLGTLGLSGKI